MTLRDTIESAVAEHETATPEAVPATEGSALTEPSEAPAAADRARDEKGRFVSGGQVPEAAKPGVAPPSTVAPVPSEPFPERPSSWKKEYWDHWGKLDPSVAKYINQRESEYAKGVSTYKTEFDRLKPLDEAMQQFMPLLQQHNIEPRQWISNLGNAHRMLALGSPQEKLAMFAKLAQDYQIPLQHLFTQGQDGQMQFNPPQMPAPQVDIRQMVEQTVQQRLAAEQSAQQLKSFTEAKDAAGNPAHPHFDEVRSTMSQLLESGLADDLESAYQAALRHPRHSEIWDAMQKQQRELEEAERQKKIKEEAERARRQAVQVKGSTPLTLGSEKPKGLRAQLSEAFDEKVSGRV